MEHARRAQTETFYSLGVPRGAVERHVDVGAVRHPRDAVQEDSSVSFSEDELKRGDGNVWDGGGRAPIDWSAVPYYTLANVRG